MKTLIAVVYVLLCVSAQAQVAAPSTISVKKVRLFCQRQRPYITFTLPINTSDQGRPGLLYIGMHDPAMSQANFLRNHTWLNWQSGLFPVYAVMRGGLYSTRLTIPLPPRITGSGWHLYAGYGALSIEDELRVQRAIDTVNKAKALNLNISGVEPDHYRRSLIQMDMSKNGKYTYVNFDIKNNSNICHSQFPGSGGR